MKIKFNDFLNEDSFQGRYETDDINTEEEIENIVRTYIEEKLGGFNEEPDGFGYYIKYGGDVIEIETNENTSKLFQKDELENMSKEIEEVVPELIERLSALNLEYKITNLGAGGFTLTKN